MAAHRGKKFEGLNLEPVATVQTRSLRSHMVKTETSPCSGQLSTIEGNPGENIEEQVKLTAEGLPEDWIKEVKPQRKGLSRKNTFYVDPKTGYAFHSLEDALRYVQTGSILSCAVIPQKRSREEMLILMNSSETKSMPCQTVKTQTATSSAQVTNQSKLGSDGLPVDWIKEVKTRKKDSSRTDMFYVDPKTGYAFCSLKDALRYVKTGDLRYCKSRPQKRSMEEIRILSSQMIKTESTASPTQPSNLINDGISGDNVCKDVQENQLTSLGFPKSWIKELKPRKNGTKLDPFYIDPDTGYAFFSLKDALRYVATGKILSCAMRPQKRSIEEVQALISSSEMSSISGTKTVQRESLQPVQLNNLHRKRKRSPVKPSDLKPEEDLNIKGTDSVTGTPSRRVKQCIEGPSRVRASPRLLALKAGNHDENNESCSTVPGMSNSSAPPDLNRLLNSLPDPKTEEEAMVENGSSTRTPLRNGKLRKERLMPHRVSPRLAAPETMTDITSVENKNSLTSKSVHEPAPSSHPYRNRQRGSHRNLENKEETIEGESGSSTGSLLRSGKMRRERPTPPLRASSRLAALTVTTDGSFVEHENLNTRPTNEPDLELKKETIEGTKGSSTGTTRRREKMHRERRSPVRASSRLAAHTDTTFVENDNSMMSNALFEPSPSLSPLNQHDLELKEATKEGANSSSTETPFRRGKMRRERGTPLRASSRLAVQKMTNDATSVQNENSTMSNALFGPTSQPDLELKEETVEGANISSTETPLRRGKMRRERGTPLRASSRLTVQKMTNDATSVQNENSTMINALFGPTRQPDLELKEETVEGANISSTETPLRRGKMRRERPTPLRASSRLATLDATNNATSVENENIATNNALFESSPSFSFINVGPASQPDLELQEERIQGANVSSTVPLRASSCHTALKAMTDCTSEENKDNIGSNAFSVPPPSHPDLNLGPTSLAHLQFKEVITGANGNGSKSTMGPTADENHEENNKTSNAVSQLPLSPARPDLNLGPASQPYWEPKVETVAAVNGGVIRITASQRVEPRREVLTSVKTSPYLEALKVSTEAASSNSNEKNRMASSALSELSHFPGRPDLNLGPTSQFTIERQEEMSRANDNSTGRPTPVNAMTETASYYNYGNNIKISNYFGVPVESPASQIITGSTRQPDPREIWFDTTAAAPSTAIADIKKAPDLNMVPMSWPEPEHKFERALGANVGPKLEQQQPAGVNTISEFHLPPPVPSEIPYQDPTMDALLSGQEAGPSMPLHMSIDALNSPLSPFFGDFWHDPCLSYAFKTLTGGMDQQRAGLGLGPENNVNWAGARNGGPIVNPSIGPSQAPTQTLQYMNNGMPFPK